MSRLYIVTLQSTSCKMLGWMKHKLESGFLRNIHNLRYADNTTLIAESGELKTLLMRMKDDSEKAGLKLNIPKRRSWHVVPSVHGI